MGSKTSPFGAFGDAISIGVLWCTYSSLTLLSPPANRYCKMGYAGNCEPSWSIPSCISTAKSAAGGGGARNKDALSDLDFWVGDEALKRNNTFTVEYPMKEGIVQNWDLMERYWQRCMFEYMRCEPEEHYFLLVRWPARAL